MIPRFVSSSREYWRSLRTPPGEVTEVEKHPKNLRQGFVVLGGGNSNIFLSFTPIYGGNDRFFFTFAIFLQMGW